MTKEKFSRYLETPNDRVMSFGMPRCEVPFRSAQKILHDEEHRLVSQRRLVTCPRCKKNVLFSEFVVSLGVYEHCMF